MPMAYRIDADASLLFIQGTGAITQEERVGAMRGWLADPAFKPGLDTYFDLTGAASTPTLAELRELMAIIHEHAGAIGRSRVAIVTSRPINFGIARVLEALADAESAPVEIKVFFSRTKAWEWLRPGYTPRDAGGVSPV